MLKSTEEGDDIFEINEINVTPFIDVILVLLIIFMIAAPLSTVDILVDLPSSNATMQLQPKDPVYLTLKKDLTILLKNKYIERSMLQVALDSLTANNREERIFIQADKEVSYGDLMRIMNLLRSAGYLKVSLISLEDK